MLNNHLRTWVEIDQKALTRNLSSIYKEVQRPMWVMIKSNAYGHGLNLIKKSKLKNQNHISKFKIIGFGVSNGQEALEIRKLDATSRIAVFGDSSDVELKDLIDHNIEISLFDFDLLERIKKYVKNAVIARGAKQSLKVHIKIETGLNRYGFRLEELNSLINQLTNSPFTLVGIYSHFSAVEEGFIRSARQQLNQFLKGVKVLDPNHKIPWHMAATGAALALPESRLDQVRIGIGAYGLYPSHSIKMKKIVDLKPALSWKTRIVNIHQLKPGETIGYGNTFRAKTPMTIAILPVGYADGYDRKLSNKGEVLIAGIRCKVLGRVFMNTVIADITQIPTPGVGIGDEVVLLGRQGSDEIYAWELANHIGTINYEVVTRINWNIPRMLSSN